MQNVKYIFDLLNFYINLLNFLYKYYDLNFKRTRNLRGNNI